MWKTKAYRLPPLVPLTDEIASGSLPTPRTSRIAAAATMTVVANISNPRGNLEEAIYLLEGRPTTGVVNPEFVEWLMGFPRMWTELPPLATPLSRKSRK